MPTIYMTPFSRDGDRKALAASTDSGHEAVGDEY